MGVNINKTFLETKYVQRVDELIYKLNPHNTVRSIGNNPSPVIIFTTT